MILNAFQKNANMNKSIEWALKHKICWIINLVDGQQINKKKFFKKCSNILCELSSAIGSHNRNVLSGIRCVLIYLKCKKQIYSKRVNVAVR